MTIWAAAPTSCSAKQLLKRFAITINECGARSGRRTRYSPNYMELLVDSTFTRQSNRPPFGRCCRTTSNVATFLRTLKSDAVILPTKHIRLERSLLGLGAELLRFLNDERTVSSLWTILKRERERVGASPITFDWFVLALDFLFTAGAIELSDSQIRRINP